MKDRKCLHMVLLIIFLITSFSTYSFAAVTPTDISKHWAKKDILSANSEGWAYLEGRKFKPDKAATREEAIWMLVGACKTLKLSDFSMNKKANLNKYKDKPSSWARDRIAIAIANGLISGYPDGTIKAKANITRAEFAVLISRKVAEEPPAGFSPFWDFIPDWAMTGVRKVYSKGITKGYPDGSFKANAPVTKAEALSMIKRWKDGMKTKATATIPDEFNKIKKVIKSELEVFPNMIDHRMEYQVNYYPKNKLFVIQLRGLNPDNYDDIKKILQVFYPKSYLEAYGYFEKAIKNSQNTTGKTLDGKGFECKRLENAVKIIISKK